MNGSIYTTAPLHTLASYIFLRTQTSLAMNCSSLMRGQFSKDCTLPKREWQTAQACRLPALTALTICSAGQRALQPRKSRLKIMVGITSIQMIQHSFTDPSSFANLQHFLQTHISFVGHISFKEESLTLASTFTFRCLQPHSVLVLDLIQLRIEEVSRDGTPLHWQLVSDSLHDKALGSCLLINLGKTMQAGESFNLTVKSVSKSTQEISAINWLKPAQTKSKKYPFLFSQCQPIYCRSIFPLQDSPRAKFTFEARISVDLPLLTPYMSAISKGTAVEDGTTFFKFEQKLPISSYLFSIICGELERGQISPRIGVISEPAVLGEALEEFKDSELYLQTLETLAFQYEWHEYNFVIMPASFPYGGMENPNLTFISPSVMHGGRGDFNVLAHEMGHSWSGNLVSCEDWTCFWLNEGFTMYLERLVTRQLFGKELEEIFIYCEHLHLEKDLKLFGEEHAYSALNVKLGQANPDDAYSIIPYYKGAEFLLWAEQLLGFEKLLAFLKAYFKKYSRLTVSIPQVKEEFRQLAGDKWDLLRWDDWVEKPGYPPVHVVKEPPKIKLIEQEIKDLLERKLAPSCLLISLLHKTDPLSNILRQTFLSRLCESAQLGPGLRDYVLQLDSEHKILALLRRKEEVTSWLQVCFKCGIDVCEQVEARVLSVIGRGKFVRPMFRAYAAFDRERAFACFRRLRSSYHSIMDRLVAKDIGFKQ